MASNDFIKAIGSFTDSLKEIVDALKKTSSDDLEKFFSDTKEQTKVALEIAQSIKDIQKDNKKIKSNTNEILRIVKSIKQSRSKSSNVIEEFGGSNNKKALMQGAGSIAIIAGSILAIGTAFKLIGEVDFESVIALGLTIPMIATVFSEISKNKDLTPARAASVGLSTVIMAGSIAISGFILSTMPSMSLAQGLSTVAIAGAMGLSLYALSKAADSMGGFDVIKIGLLASAMPMVALGLSGAAYFLTTIPTISLEKGLTAVAIAGAMGLAMYGISKAAGAFDGTSTAKILGLSAVMPLVALGLLGSAYALQKLPAIQNPLNLVINAVAVAGAIAATALGIKAMLLMGLDKNPSGTLMGAALMPVLAGSIMASSWVLSLGEYSKGPSVEWAKAFGLSMLAAVPSVLILGGIASTGVGALVIGAGILAMGTIAGGLAGISHIINTGNYKGGPSEEWALGTGKSLMYFIEAMSEAAPGVSDLLIGNTITTKIDGLKATARAMVEVANELSVAKASFKNGPGKDWAEGTGSALIMFIKAMNDVGEGKIDGLLKSFIGGNNEQKFKTIKDITNLMVLVNAQLAESKSTFKAGPKKDWAEGTGSAIISFAKAIHDVDSTGGVLNFIGDFLTGDKNLTIKNLATTIAESSLEIAKGNYNVSMKADWGTGISEAIKAIASIGDVSDEIDDSLESIKLIGLNLPTISNVMRGLNVAMAGGQSINKSTSDIERLAKAYMSLANAVSSISSGVSGIDGTKMSGVTSISSSLLTLSMINSKALKENIETLNTSSDKIKTVFSKISSIQNDTGIASTKENNAVVEQNIKDNKLISAINATEQVNTVEEKNKLEPNPFKNIETLLTSIESILSIIQNSVGNIEDTQDSNSLANAITH